MSVTIYTSGFVHCSVCAPKDQTRESVEQEVNALNPTGLNHGWKIDDAPTFATGDVNPCICNTDPERLHYLMVC